tara:strand:+ start:2289 stop:2624 length:336 start_codon:yes stop_codon:yes gene_type:complete
MKTRHTPAPWTWHSKKHEDGSMNGSVVFIDEHLAHCVCKAPKFQDEEKWEANAKLMAAAPELLDALMAMDTFLKHIGENNAGWVGDLVLQDYSLMTDAYNKTSTALSKATS